MKCLKYHLTFLPQILHATEQWSPQIRDNVCIMYVDIEVSNFLYIRYSYTYTDCWCDNDNLYNLHQNKAFDPIKANPGNWSWNITNPHAVVVSDNDLTGDVVAGPHQVPLGLPVQPALHPVPVQGVAPQRLRERGPLHLHPPPARGRPAVWRAAVRALEPHTERPHHPHQRGQPSQWTQHFQVIIAYETKRK